MKKRLSKTIKIAVFKGKKIRRHWDEKNEKWWFAVVDVVEILSESKNPQVYWRVLKKRLLDEGSNQTVTKCNALKMKASDGKMRMTDTADTETMLRIIQSIPSPNAEPFKLWLAKEDGSIAGSARRKLEKKTGKKIVSRLKAKDLNLLK